MLRCLGQNVVGEGPSQARMLQCHKESKATQAHMMHIKLMKIKAYQEKNMGTNQSDLETEQKDKCCDQNGTPARLQTAAL